MKAEDFFNRQKILNLSFFNFRNAITAAYYANDELEIQSVNNNFKKFFPILGNVTNVKLPHVLEQLGIPGEQIDTFVNTLKREGSVLIPQVHIAVDGKNHVFSLLSAKTKDDEFSYLNGVQGQFVDRTEEWKLKKEREELLDQKLRDQEIIEQKSKQLESLAMRLAKYLSPQIYASIFSETEDQSHSHARKNLTVFFSDIVQFTDLSDTMEPERLALVINSYLSEMATVAIDCGGTIDKFIGDAVLVFFGDPESAGEREDALNCIEMAIQMRERVAGLQKFWKKNGATRGLQVRMGIATGFCTVGNFGSDQRLDYTALGSPVNLAARLQGTAEPDTILIDENTLALVDEEVDCSHEGEITPKGFARPVQIYRVDDFKSGDHRRNRQVLSRTGEHVEVNVIDSTDIRAAIEELRQIQMDFEQQAERLEDSSD
ncbi:MAG: adenylate/guanylate cyclase domain-containing protein [Hyphomicrobiales bacterium]